MPARVARFDLPSFNSHPSLTRGKNQELSHEILSGADDWNGGEMDQDS